MLFIHMLQLSTVSHYLDEISNSVVCATSKASEPLPVAILVKMSHCWKSHVTAHIISPLQIEGDITENVDQKIVGTERDARFVVEIDQKIISMLFCFIPLDHSRMVAVSCKRKCVHTVLVNGLFKLAQEKCG